MSPLKTDIIIKFNREKKSSFKPCLKHTTTLLIYVFISKRTEIPFKHITIITIFQIGEQGTILSWKPTKYTFLRFSLCLSLDNVNIIFTSDLILIIIYVWQINCLPFVHLVALSFSILSRALFIVTGPCLHMIDTLFFRIIYYYHLYTYGYNKKNIKLYYFDIYNYFRSLSCNNSFLFVLCVEFGF